MAIPEAYVTVPGNLTRFLEAIQTAGVPPRVTFEFVKTLGLKSSNDRPIITVMKAIGFLDSSGSPTDLYKRYRNKGQSGRVLAEALRAAYADLFMANTNAQDLSPEKLKGIVATKTDKGERVVKEIVATFKALCKVADFSLGDDEVPDAPSVGEVAQTPAAAAAGDRGDLPRAHARATTFHYNIQIHLPTTTDISVYNAIFKSLREQLL